MNLFVWFQCLGEEIHYHMFSLRNNRLTLRIAFLLPWAFYIIRGSVSSSTESRLVASPCLCSSPECLNQTLLLDRAFQVNCAFRGRGGSKLSFIIQGGMNKANWWGPLWGHCQGHWYHDSHQSHLRPSLNDSCLDERKDLLLCWEMVSLL